MILHAADATIDDFNCSRGKLVCWRDCCTELHSIDTSNPFCRHWQGNFESLRSDERARPIVQHGRLDLLHQQEGTTEGLGLM